ncbi:hypothetical protein NXT08_23845 (plasmid) [Rhodococcus pyridinivorans]|uniref:hypothetical protein n=1 Tax=Rhodococcus TaxID=1827 RepID=UPI0012E85DED|nr:MULTISPECIES: hypothetical protein [Rhodococcus]MCT7294237.1 hypothetical protein [Rhodococcus sp. PAE-6]QXU56543.1 hypothetical protein KXC42_25430 [Rhodococcus sp. LW-XY12]UQB75911.1 hypothetical protein KI427_27100 [Rhodococcus ruber]UVT27593.1 hypothetical protein NXT08_23845 [Rhodococcus pyridinivorans]WML66243.1 hypothetical protein QNA09_28550 [Rhodococcus sp. AH-ZY2]
MSTGVPSRQRANAGLDQNSDSLQIIFREGTPARDPQVLIIARALYGCVTKFDKVGADDVSPRWMSISALLSALPAAAESSLWWKYGVGSQLRCITSL